MGDQHSNICCLPTGPRWGFRSIDQSEQSIKWRSPWTAPSLVVFHHCLSPGGACFLSHQLKHTSGSHITQTESMSSLRCINLASLSQEHVNYAHSWLTTHQILNTTPNLGHLLTTRHPVCPQILQFVFLFKWPPLLTTTAPGYKHPSTSDMTP